MRRVHIAAGGGYPVLIGEGLLEQAGALVQDYVPAARTAALVCDSNVAPLYLDRVAQSLSRAGLRTVHFLFPAGEGSKNGQTYLELLEFLADNQITRSDAIVALGGGVTGDLAGFAAATFLRGIALIQMPTSLLAMVDSSVGGKTAIDLKAGKNLAGAFYQPSLVLCDTGTLQTLPQERFADGMAEVIKYGMLKSKALLEQLLEQSTAFPLEDIIVRCVTIKGDLVGLDERDTGLRRLLNLGHTIGHAIEQCSGYQISHGQAVAIGMRMITRAAADRGLCPTDCLQLLDALLERWQLPGKTILSPDSLFAAALGDKKRMADQITLVVPTGTGVCDLLEIPIAQLRQWIEWGLAL